MSYCRVYGYDACTMPATNPTLAFVLESKAAKAAKAAKGKKAAPEPEQAPAEPAPEPKGRTATFTYEQLGPEEFLLTTPGLRFRTPQYNGRLVKALLGLEFDTMNYTQRPTLRVTLNGVVVKDGEMHFYDDDDYGVYGDMLQYQVREATPSTSTQSP